MDHPDPEVRQALIRLNDALCTWERNTGRQSMLILREQGGLEFRTVNGKPGVPADIEDRQLMALVR